MKHLTLSALALGIALAFPIVSTGRQGPEELTREKIFATGQEWQDKYDKLGPGMKIVVFLGLWCPDSRNNVPLFIKLLDRLGTEVPVRYFGVPRKTSREVKFYVEEYNVEKVPTFIFYKEGKELGRIIENPKTGLLEDIFDIFFK
jgi:thiol-disulfide isomerase/thioredoxin